MVNALTCGYSWASRNQWHVDGLLVGYPFSAWPAVLAKEVAIVGHKEDVTIRQFTQIGQCLDNPLNGFVYGQQGLHTGPVLVIKLADLLGIEEWAAFLNMGRFVAHIGLVERRRSRRRHVRQSAFMAGRRRRWTVWSSLGMRSIRRKVEKHWLL